MNGGHNGKPVTHNGKPFNHNGNHSASNNRPPLAFDALGKPIPRVENALLSASEKKILKDLLTKERDRVVHFLEILDNKSLGHNSGDGERDRSSYSIHQADYASDNQSLNLALAQRQIEAVRLEAIEYALRQIDTKVYGKCRKCSANIGFDRMQAKPYAEYCIVCHSELAVTQR